MESLRNINQLLTEVILEEVGENLPANPQQNLKNAYYQVKEALYKLQHGKESGAIVDESDEARRLRIENEAFRKELIAAELYGINPDLKDCICPKFYKKDGPFAGVSYNCPLHGR